MASYFEPVNPNVLTAANKVISGTTSVPVIRPSLATAPVINSGVGAWVMGGWVQFVAAADLAGHMLIGAVFGQGPDTQYDIEIGTGAAGFEVVAHRIPLIYASTVGPGIYVPVNPGVTIPANARVAARMASIGGGVSLSCKMVFIPRPLVG